MLVVLLLLLIAPLQPCGEEVRSVRAYLAAEEVERVREPVVDVALNDFKRDAADFAHVLVLFHQLRRAFDNAADASLAYKEVMRLLGQHKLARARERLEPTLG